MWWEIIGKKFAKSAQKNVIDSNDRITFLRYVFSHLSETNLNIAFIAIIAP